VSFREHCFLRSPEWQALLLKSPAWPFHAVQSQTLSLRTRLSSILVDLPSLIIQCSAIGNHEIQQPGWEEGLDILMHKASTMFDSVSRLLTMEAEPLFLPYASSKRNMQESITYPDIISGVIDCVANTALLTLHKIMHLLCKTRLQSGSLDRQEQIEASQPLNDPEAIERYRQRAITAFNFVQAESALAAKPLDFGLRRVQSWGSSCSISIAVR
jgi:hypothetical protein